jgi:hypothetical protein
VPRARAGALICKAPGVLGLSVDSNLRFPPPPSYGSRYASHHTYRMSKRSVLSLSADSNLRCPHRAPPRRGSAARRHTGAVTVGWAGGAGRRCRCCARRWGSRRRSSPRCSARTHASCPSRSTGTCAPRWRGSRPPASRARRWGSFWQRAPRSRPTHSQSSSAPTSTSRPRPVSNLEPFCLRPAPSRSWSHSLSAPPRLELGAILSPPRPTGYCVPGAPRGRGRLTRGVRADARGRPRRPARPGAAPP